MNKNVVEDEPRTKAKNKKERNDVRHQDFKFWVNMSLSPVIWAGFGLPPVKKSLDSNLVI